MAKEGFSINVGGIKLKTPVFIAAAILIVIVLIIIFSGSNNEASITGGVVAVDFVEEVTEPIVEETEQIMVEEYQTLETELTICQATLTELQISERNLESYWTARQEMVVKTYDSELEIKEEQLEEALESNWQTIENAADSICCKEKVDNENIDSFQIIDDMIECTEGSGHSIEC